MAQNIIFYGTSWCGDCFRAKRIFEQHNIPYDWVDIDLDSEASKYVQRINNGNRSVPTIIFPEGDILVEPSNFELETRLGLR